MRIAMLHYAAPPLVGGVETTIYHHARLLAEAGHGVSVIAGRGEAFHPRVVFHRIPEVDSSHTQVLAVGRALARGQVPTAFATLRNDLAARLRPLLAECDVCLVHNAVTLHKNLPLTAALRLLAGEGLTRLVAWCHDLGWRDALYTPDLHEGYPWDLLRTRWPGVSYVVVSAHRRSALAELLRMPETAIRVVHPGVDVAEFLKLEPMTRELVKKLDLLAADPLLLLPARVTRRKNIELAIQVTAALTRSKPRATLLVTGPPGPHNTANVAYLESLQELRERLKVADRVHFLYQCGDGDTPLHVTNSMMSDLFRLADVLLFPSQREGFGIPMLEAGLARLPIFCTDIAPFQESGDGVAHYFSLDDSPAQIARRIMAFLARDRAHRMRRRVLRCYTWSAILRQEIMPLLQECLDECDRG